LQLSAEYSLWFIVPILFMALGCAWFFYKGNPLKLEEKNAKTITITLGIIRFFSIFIALLLLLGIFLNLITQNIEKPLVVILSDASSSITQSSDAKFYKEEYAQELNQISEELSNDYVVKRYLYSDELTSDKGNSYSGKATNIAIPLQAIADKYADENLSAVVLTGDGLYNQGSNPLDIASAFPVSIYTVLLGDTISSKDLFIKQVRNNEVAFTGNNIAIQVDVSAYELNSSNTILSISQNGKVLLTKPIQIASNRFFQTHSLVVPAIGGGMQQYTIKIDAINGERNIANNIYNVYVNLIDNKQKILLIANTPHPDLGALRKAIETNEGYACDLAYIQSFNTIDIEKYSLVIAHQLPGWRAEGLSLLQLLKSKNVPIMLVVGSQTGLNYLMQLEPSIRIQYKQNVTNEVLPKYNEQFTLFGINEDEQLTFNKLPPLSAPFGNYQLFGDYEVLFSQHIGSVASGFPLWLFVRNNGNRSAIIFGEGIWKWYLADFGLSQQQHVPLIINKTIQYLSVRKDRSRFVLQHKPRFFENEPLFIEAERYNESYELTQEDEVTIVVKNEKGKDFKYTFSKNNNRYQLQAGLLPAGKYTYIAIAERNGKAESKKGSFIIIPLQLELLSNVADAQMMNELAVSTGGKMVSARNLMTLKNLIINDKTIKPIIREQESLKKWIDYKWLFFTLIVLLTTEWGIRKWNGTL
jgi:hypothetical protein